MKILLRYTFIVFFFYQLVFFVHRIFFILYQQPIGAKIHDKTDIIRSFIKGYQLDLSVGAMLTLLPMVMAIIFYVSEKIFFKKAAGVLVVVMLIIYGMTSIGDAGLYKEWNAKINMQALEHFKNPSEVFKTLSPKLLLLFVLFVSLITLPFSWLYFKKIHTILKPSLQRKISTRLAWGIAWFLVGSGIGIITIRGGITNMPINQSIAYFSNDVLANDIAVNPLYNILQDATIKTKIPDSTIYKLRSNDAAWQLIKEDFTVPKDTSISILNTSRPNLVYIFLESWSADNVSKLGGIEGCTPQFNQLCNEGLLFTKAYGAAYVSDQGIPAVLSAYPSVSRIAIINQAAKVPNLPCISEDLLPYHYSSSFLFGGELVYGNLRGYFLEKKFTDLKEVYDLRKYPEGRIGVHDEYTFQELLQVLNQRQQPFLQGFFTTSTHMPYDFTPSDNWTSRDDDAEKKYTESVHYSDLHMGRFFEAAKKQPWYANTLFIVIADHSHNSIKQWDISSSMRQHIPLLMLGGALKKEWQGKTWDKIVSQLDITSSILHQMQLPTSRYPWSRDIFNPYTPSSAYFVFFGGGGYVNEQGYASSHLENQSHIIHEVKDSNLIKPFNDKAMSYQQLVYEDVRTRK
ncbi:MAG TPA: LTA synthase family protein [Chitinophagaceae bacterium]|nr:LTA synthase family protein [Chitinophagaceae bacterium]